MFELASLFIPNSEVVRPLIDIFIGNKVPKVASVTFAYAVIGVYWLERYRGRK